MGILISSSDRMYVINIRRDVEKMEIYLITYIGLLSKRN